MHKFADYINENLGLHIQSEPSSEAARQAKSLGLTYIGFARYADATGKVAYVVQNGQLVPYKSGEQVQAMSDKASNGSFNDPEQQAIVDQELKRINKVKRQDIKYLTQSYKEINQTAKNLGKSYKPDMFAPEELQAISDYTNDLFNPVNGYLYKGFDMQTDPNTIQAVQNNVSMLDSAFDRTATPFDYHVYTGLTQRYDPAHFRAGKDYVFRGYVSTSLDFAKALDTYSQLNQQGYKTLLQIYVRKGQKSIYTDGLTGNKDDKEVLLPRGSKVRIASGPHLIDDEIVSQYPNGSQVALFMCDLIQET